MPKKPSDRILEIYREILEVGHDEPRALAVSMYLDEQFEAEEKEREIDARRLDEAIMEDFNNSFGQ